MALELDTTQSAVVHCDSSKILVVAGSGSGKTRVLTERLKLLLEDVEDSSKIVAITFTNAAAEEMKERLGDTKAAFIGTIHSYANRILLMNGYDTSQYIEEENQYRLKCLHNYAQDMLFKRMDEIDYIGTCCGVVRAE